MGVGAPSRVQKQCSGQGVRGLPPKQKFGIKRRFNTSNRQQQFKTALSTEESYPTEGFV